MTSFSETYCPIMRMAFAFQILEQETSAKVGSGAFKKRRLDPGVADQVDV